MLVLDAVKLCERYDVEAAAEKLEAIKKTALTVITVASLEQLARGGRMSNTTAAFGKLLHINPIIYMEDGALVAKNKAIGRQKALDMVKKLTLEAMGGQPKKYDYAMLHAKALNEATAMSNELRSVTGVAEVVPPLELGATIGMHTGPSVVAVAFMHKI